MSAAREVYPGPRPFAIGEQDLFFGRVREQNDLTDLLFSYPLVLLYAQSGAGKSSLLCAGLIPSLEPGDWVLARVAGELPPPDLADVNVYTYNVLQSGVIPVRPGATLASALARPADGPDRPWFLLLDQFEELFTYYPERWRQREPFLKELSALLKQDRNAHVLLAAREEWIAYLDRFSGLFPDGVRIRYRLEPLREAGAREAILKPAAIGSEAFLGQMRQVADRLIANLSRIPVRTPGGITVEIEGEFVEPVHLQLVCTNLWQRFVRDRQPMSEREIETLLDVDDALRRLYDAALRKVAGHRFWREFTLRGFFQTQLITPAGTRGTVYLDEARGRTGGIPNDALKQLESERILRRELRGGAPWYEITHDRFIKPITASNAVHLSRRRARVVGTTSLLAVVALLAGFSISRNQVAALRQTVQQTRADNRRVLVEAAATLSKGENPGDTARTMAALGLAQWKIGDSEQARWSFQQAGKADAWEGLKLLNTSVGRENSPAARAAWREYMKSLKPYLASNPELKAWSCAHSAVVVGASEPVATAADELARMRRNFPGAELGLVYGKNQQIYAGLFLTCDEARQIVADVQRIYQTKPFIGNWYDPVCAWCDDLPRVGRPSRRGP